MKKSNFSETQILKIVAEAESGRKIGDICREHGISQQTFYNWHKKYSGMEPNQLRPLSDLLVTNFHSSTLDMLISSILKYAPMYSVNNNQYSACDF
jgi:S-adenosylmethionine:tRNA-ribosyltransferase-isomerase (queuine synthetase)